MSCLSPMNADTTEHRCRGSLPLDEALTAAHATALVGAEGDDGLAAEIETLKEGINHHRHRAPPVRVAENDGVVPVDAVELIPQFRASLLTELCLAWSIHS